MHKLIVTNQSELASLEISGVEIVSPKNYFIQERFSKLRNVRVFNLCRDYSYQSKGYYVSLLAEARGHKPLPDVKNLQDIKTSSIIKSLTDDLDELIQRSLKNIKSKEFILSVYFGQNVAIQHDKLSLELHKLFSVPLFRARFIFIEKWVLQGVKTIGMKDVPEHHFGFLKDAAHDYFDKKRYHKPKELTIPFDLAILVNKDEKAPPSNERALVRFKQIAEKHGFFVEFITKDDANRINEFDALFIRATTSVNHFTYKIARKAESEGLAVIDDPSSILKCANKVYLAELLRNAKIDTPKTLIIHSDNRKEVAETLGMPCILKLPDSSFSIGVVKVSTQDELNETLKKMLDQSDLLIGQSYMPTDFDWRIGVIDGKAFYACKYFMARGHWQIYNWSSGDKEDITGEFESLAIEHVPAFIIETAERATTLIGTGLYGVDIKEWNGKAIVIEINDNPSIDFGVEDHVDKDLVYEKIIGSLKRKVISRTSNDKYDHV
jgi:glutathione synthase/RimK-type ligase-like ATP-grasp enzyme